MSNPEVKKRSATIVRTLKPPPEIWELVHPVEERQFSPRLTFLTRLRQSAINLILIAIVGGLVLGVCMAVFRFRGAQQPTATETRRPLQVDSTAKAKDTPNQPNPAPPIASTAAQPIEVAVSQDPAPAPSRVIKRKTSVVAGVQRTDIASSETTLGGRPQPPKTDQQSKAATDTEKKTVADPPAAKPKTTAALGTVLVAPPKSAPTPKPKVIQWP